MGLEEGSLGLNKRGSKRETEKRGGDGSRLTEYVFELSGECPSFRGGG